MNQHSFLSPARNLAVSKYIILALRSFVPRRRRLFLGLRCTGGNAGPVSGMGLLGARTSVADGRERRGRLARAKREAPAGFVIDED